MHQPLGLDEAGGVDLVPLPLAGDAGDLEATGQIGSSLGPRSVAEEGAEVGLVVGEQAIPELAVGRQSGAGCNSRRTAG